jgi:hypothetical protein
VLRAEVAGDGMVDLVAVVTDPIAVTKVSERAYTGILCSFDGDEIASINLIDSPAAFMAKSSRVICKLYDGGGAVSEWKAARRALERAGIRPATVITAVEAAVRKSSERRLPVSAQQAFAEIERTEKALESGTCGDRMAATAQNQRARQLLGVEFIKAARQTGNRLWGPKFG